MLPTPSQDQHMRHQPKFQCQATLEHSAHQAHQHQTRAPVLPSSGAENSRNPAVSPRVCSKHRKCDRFKTISVKKQKYLTIIMSSATSLAVRFLSILCLKQLQVVGVAETFNDRKYCNHLHQSLTRGYCGAEEISLRVSSSSFV